MEKAIKIAIENGWKPKYDFSIEYPSQIFFTDDGSLGLNGEGGKVLGILEKEKIIIDPLFWQALGKGLGWTWEGEHETGIPAWNRVWHSFIDHLAEGKDINSFFEELTK